MSYLPELHYCLVCNIYLGPDNGDGLCSLHDYWPPRDKFGKFRKYDVYEIIYSHKKVVK